MKIQNPKLPCLAIAFLCEGGQILNKLQTQSIKFKI